MPRKPIQNSSLDKRRQAYTGAKVAYQATKALARWGLRRLAKNTINKTFKRSPSGSRMFVRITPVGTGASQSWYSHRRSVRLGGKVLKQLQPLRVMNQATSSRVEGAIGAQAVYADKYLTVGQIQDLFAQLTSGGSSTQRIYVKKVTADFLISNATSSNTFVRIYELVARRDFSITTNSSGALSSSAIWTPEGAFDQGLYDVSASTSNSATALGNTPFQSKLFTQLWKVNKVYNIELGSGRSHKHTVAYDINQFIDESILGTVGARRNQILRGITRATMIITYGGPVNSDATDTNVSTAKPALNIVRMDRHYCHVVDPQGQQYYRISTLPTFSDPQEVDDEGNVQAPSEA